MESYQEELQRKATKIQIRVIKKNYKEKLPIRTTQTNKLYRRIYSEKQLITAKEKN